VENFVEILLGAFGLINEPL